MASGSSGSRVRVIIARYSEETLPGRSEWNVWAISEGLINYEAGWRTTKISSAMTSIKLAAIRSKYCIVSYIQLIVPKAYEYACYVRPRYVTAHGFLFKAGTLCLASLI